MNIDETIFTKEDATKFFAELYYGEHHIPNYKVHEHGSGWMVKDYTNRMATTDFNNLTRFVLMCHRDCIRGEILPCNFNYMKICIWKRKRTGGLSQEHPTIEQAIEKFNSK